MKHDYVILILFFRILNFVRNFPNGVSDKDIQKEIPEIDVQKRVEILNSLVRQVTTIFDFE